MSRCTGHCCETFRLRDAEQKVMAANVAIGDVDSCVVKYMLIHKERVDGGDLFTCQHWDRLSRNCTIYKDRPSMCRNYPHYGDDTRQCLIEGCALGECHESDAPVQKVPDVHGGHPGVLAPGDHDD